MATGVKNLTQDPGVYYLIPLDAKELQDVKV
jgi:hypothetical protein